MFEFSGKISSRGRSYGGGRHDDVDDDDFVDSVGDQVVDFSEFSLYCIKKDNPVRQVCISILMSP